MGGASNGAAAAAAPASPAHDRGARRVSFQAQQAAQGAGAGGEPGCEPGPASARGPDGPPGGGLRVAAARAGSGRGGAGGCEGGRRSPGASHHGSPGASGHGEGIQFTQLREVLRNLNFTRRAPRPSHRLLRLPLQHAGLRACRAACCHSWPRVRFTGLPCARHAAKSQSSCRTCRPHTLPPLSPQGTSAALSPAPCASAQAPGQAGRAHTGLAARCCAWRPVKQDDAVSKACRKVSRVSRPAGNW
jgi:hypothetical protein